MSKLKYYTPKEVNEQLIPPHLEEEFDNFILGQTCPMVDGVGACYYKHDVDRFLNRHNIEPLDGTVWE